MRQILFFLLLLPALLKSQTCLPGGITFSTQADIDNFATYYPGCTEILGFVSIVEFSNGAINNLNGLHPITKIHGGLDIRFIDDITSLNGLGSLDSIGGNCLIQFNQSLHSLSGFDNLISIGGYIEIHGNQSLQSVSGLGQLKIVEGDFEISDNDALLSLAGLGSITTIGGDLWISSNAVLASITGLESLTSIGQLLRLNSNLTLTSLSGLDNLISCGTVSLIGNPGLVSLNGLQNLSSINGSLAIVFNANLNSFADLSNVTSINGIININNNTSLTSLQGLENINALSINASSSTASDIIITNNSLLSTCEVQSICDAIDLSTTITDIQNNASNCNSEAEVQAACDSVLPVTWLSLLRATIHENNVHLSWTVGLQENNKEFIIEWSVDGKRFRTIDVVPGLHYSSTMKEYEVQHNSPILGDNYYRIKQVDHDSKYSHSNIAHAKIDVKPLHVVPNPFHSTLAISLPQPSKVDLIDIYLRTIQQFDLVEGNHTMDLSHLHPGIYFLKIDRGVIQRLIKQ